MAFDAFLKIDGIEGESRDAKHKGEIDVLSFSFGVANAGAPGPRGGGAGAGKATFQDLHVVTRVEKSTPQLLLACASGKHLKQAVLTLRKSGAKQQDFLRITLSEVLISSYVLGGAAGGEPVPIAETSLAFGKLSLDYDEQSPSGKAGATSSMEWDVRQNKGK